MIILRGYKSVVSSVILTTFISLHCFTSIRCSDDYTKEIENQNEINNKNNIDDIIKEMEGKHTWTFFKIIITPDSGIRKKDNLKIENIISKEYINNSTSFFKLFNRKHNALLLDEKAAQKIKETMEIKSNGNNNINNNENKNINNENININNNENININNSILKEENSKDNKKSTYYVLVKDITTKKYENGYYIPLFIELENKAMFGNFTYSIEIIDANTTGVTNMSYMFKECKKLTEIVGLDKWKTDNVEYMNHMFCNCSSLSYLPNISNCDTNNVTNMSYMFSGCSSLKSLPANIANWNTDNVTDMEGMFYNCEKLEEFPDISNWNTNKVTNMRCMFDCCESLTKLPNISNWDTSKVTDMSYMFYNCKVLRFEKQDFKLIIKSQQCNTEYITTGCNNLIQKDNCIQNK